MADFSMNSDEMSRLKAHLDDLETTYSGLELPSNPGPTAFGVPIVASAYDIFRSDFAERSGTISKWCSRTSLAVTNTVKYAEDEDWFWVQVWSLAFNWDSTIPE